MKLLVCSLSTAVALTLAGCGDNFNENEKVAVEHSFTSEVDTNDTSRVIEIQNIVRVFLHEPEHYSVMSLGRSNRLVFHDLAQKHATVYADVPTNGSMWAAYSEAWNGRCEIHISSPADINGAGWHTDKRYGMTSAVR